MNYVKGQFVRLPHVKKLKASGIKYTDILVYVSIRSFDNPFNGCFPSYEKIAERANCSRDYVIKAIGRLTFFKILKVKKSAKIKVVNRYSFYESYLFEQIPYQILFDLDLTLYEKSMLLCLRQLFNTNGKLAVRIRMKDIADILGISYKVVHQQMTALLDKGYITRGPKTDKNFFKLTEKIDWNWDYSKQFEPVKPILKLKVG